MHRRLSQSAVRDTVGNSTYMFLLDIELLYLNEKNKDILKDNVTVLLARSYDSDLKQADLK